MKVLFLSHMFPNQLVPNTVPFMLERARSLSALVDLKVIAPIPYFPIAKSACPPIEEDLGGIKVYHPRYVSLPTMLWAWRWLPYWRMLKRISLDTIGSYDIVHVEWIYPDAFALVNMMKRKTIKAVGVVHGNEAVEYFGPANRREKYIEAFQGLDHIIVVSKDLKNKLINEYFVDSEKVSVILNGVDVGKFTLIDKKLARQQLKVSVEGIIGVCVARLSEEKNLHILIRAVAKLKQESPMIYIVGDGPLRKKLEALVKSLNIGDKIRLVGAVPHNNVATWLNAADFFYLPSQREGCPVVVHEALACGVPVIATSVGAIPDLVKDDRYGLLCEPDSVSAFADIMKKAMSRKWDRNVISSYGRQFTWDKMARETVKIYTSILR